MPCLLNFLSPDNLRFIHIFQNFSGPDYPSIRPPILILSVHQWPGVNEQQVYRVFQNLCKFDVRRLARGQFLLLTNKFKE